MRIVSLIFFLFFFFVCFFLFYYNYINYTRIYRDFYIFRDVFKGLFIITFEVRILEKSTLCNVPCHYQLINTNVFW